MTSGAGVGGMFTAEAAGVVLVSACRTAGFDPAGAELLRLGSNAVYRLAGTPVIVRIARDPGSLPDMTRAVRVARWLESEGFAATRVVADLEQPLVVDGRVVTFWVSAQDAVVYADLRELGDLLRRLHWLEEPGSLALPYYDPFQEVWDTLRALGDVPGDDVAFLNERAERIQKEYGRLDWVLDFGMIHGDANVGNAIRDRDGRPLLIDLDGFSLGQREWDLVLTSLYYERFGWHTRTEYESFVYHYGFDLMNWPGYPVLADLRELKMTLWIGHQVTTSEKAAEEFARRVHALRTDGSRKDWQAF
ncbi:phosphotransferase family protein [Streptomyces qinzhouensis]|uniref:Aminoglycoside phosphotransferase family protein n=1 Tax=Streptomyces qinzhouensis TaxID=2599401 RepID=A0A5B8IMD5_9ACTN|nr:aminoglycoside phosphotransferase family protein [Streptomyces qinzhouensis]QDY79762.1 aminoglycoside phosphotransferase family protein [Streptomyces qinzhouensis]